MLLCGGEAWCRFVGEGGGKRLAEVGEEAAVLESAGAGGAEESFGRAQAALGVVGEGELALDHCWARQRSAWLLVGWTSCGAEAKVGSAGQSVSRFAQRAALCGRRPRAPAAGAALE